MILTLVIAHVISTSGVLRGFIIFVTFKVYLALNAKLLSYSMKTSYGSLFHHIFCANFRANSKQPEFEKSEEAYKSISSRH